MLYHYYFPQQVKKWLPIIGAAHIAVHILVVPTREVLPVQLPYVLVKIIIFLYVERCGDMHMCQIPVLSPMHMLYRRNICAWGSTTIPSISEHIVGPNLPRKTARTHQRLLQKHTHIKDYFKVEW